jgi:hypothetical protein
MSIDVEEIKELAIKEVGKRVHSENLAKAFRLLMFGGFGVTGLVDVALLAKRANAKTVSDLTEDTAVDFILEVAKQSLAASLELKAAGAIDAAGITSADVARMSRFIATGLLSQIYNEQDPRPNPNRRSDSPIHPCYSSFHSDPVPGGPGPGGPGGPTPPDPGPSDPGPDRGGPSGPSVRPMFRS